MHSTRDPQRVQAPTDATQPPPAASHAAHESKQFAAPAPPHRVASLVVWKQPQIPLPHKLLISAQKSAVAVQEPAIVATHLHPWQMLLQQSVLAAQFVGLSVAMQHLPCGQVWPTGQKLQIPSQPSLSPQVFPVQFGVQPQPVPVGPPPQVSAPAQQAAVG